MTTLIILLLSVLIGLLGYVAYLWQGRRSAYETQHQTMVALARLFPDNLLIVDGAGRIIAYSPSACEYFGYQPQQLAALEVEDLLPIRYAERHRQLRLTFLAGKPGKAMDNEVSCLHQSGEEIPATIRVRTFELDQREYGLIAIQDLRDFKDREMNLKKLAELDPLTGLANRRLFDHDYHREWSRAMREQQPLSVLMLDVDYFKSYNDLHGHSAGDACLQQLAELLQEALGRGTDCLARYGGEEFIFLLPNMAVELAQKKAQALCDRVFDEAIPHGASPISPWVTVSIGVATRIPTNMEEMHWLVDAADNALYTAKGVGRNCVMVFGSTREHPSQ